MISENVTFFTVSEATLPILAPCPVPKVQCWWGGEGGEEVREEGGESMRGKKILSLFFLK